MKLKYEYARIDIKTSKGWQMWDEWMYRLSENERFITEEEIRDYLYENEEFMNLLDEEKKIEVEYTWGKEVINFTWTR